MSGWYDVNDLWSLAAANNLIVDSQLSKQKLFDLLLILGLVDKFPSRIETTGILGWDIDYTPSLWVRRITGDNWDPKLNPTLSAEGSWIHHTNFVNLSIIDSVLDRISRLKKEGRERWTSVLPHVIVINKLELGKCNITKSPHCDCAAPFDDFIDNNYNVALVGWGEHMRFVYKNARKRHLFFYDPWKKDLEHQPFFRAIKTHVSKRFDYSSEFVSRKADQGEENSCVIDCIARAIMIAEYGSDAATWEWDDHTFDYAVLAVRLIRMASE